MYRVFFPNMEVTARSLETHGLPFYGPFLLSCSATSVEDLPHPSALLTIKLIPAITVLPKISLHLLPSPTILQKT